MSGFTGTVTGSSAAPATGECVTAFPVNVQVSSIFGSPSPEIAVTDPQGRYSLGFLFPGTYKVRFDVGCGATGLATQWWKDAATRAGATIITVPANATVIGINATVR